MSLVRADREGGVAIVTLNRAGMGNALVPELLDALLERLAQLAVAEDLRAVLLRAEGAAFSLGGDMRRFRREYQGDIAAYAARLVGRLNAAMLALIDLPQPVVCAVQGPVTGGGLGLVLACDLVLVSPQAVFKAHYATAGFSPDGGWATLFASLAGRRRAAACLLLNRSVSAEEAVDWGIANRIVDGERLEEEARAAALKMARYPEGTMRNAKRLLWRDRNDIAAALEAERQRFAECIGGAQPGVEAFLRDFAGYPDVADVADVE
ncbi:MAG: enoyl-CoA hydratase/isomerase family protein [Rhodocyclales bacterium]|nr:enoyl-CoA hydratase/isomerase family protein [Rhodocyclales bacterium]